MCEFYFEINASFLFRLREKHGNDWATIGAALGRSASSVKDRCRLMKDTCNTGQHRPSAMFVLKKSSKASTFPILPVFEPS